MVMRSNSHYLVAHMAAAGMAYSRNAGIDTDASLSMKNHISGCVIVEIFNENSAKMAKSRKYVIDVAIPTLTSLSCPTRQRTNWEY